MNDYDIKMCQGCKFCFDKGEEFCPLNDDRNVLLAKLEKSDGVIFASPNYAFGVSGVMKNFIDRIAYIFHRPRFFGKTYTVVVTQGVFGGSKILKYLQTTGLNLGFNLVKGVCITSLEPMSDSQEEKMKKEMINLAKRFNKDIDRKKQPKPSLFRLMMFRMTRNALKFSENKMYDYKYFKKVGWFESDYYYEVKLGPIKKSFGKLFDYFGKKIAKK